MALGASGHVILVAITTPYLHKNTLDVTVEQFYVQWNADYDFLSTFSHGKKPARCSSVPVFQAKTYCCSMEIFRDFCGPTVFQLEHWNTGTLEHWNIPGFFLELFSLE